VELAAWRGGDAIATSQFGGFMSRLKIIAPAVILLGGFLVCSMATYGKMEFTKATKKPCTYCHEKNVPGDPAAMKANLTDAGKYYKEKKTLDGYVEKK
jgi:cytochrome c553